ncbi:hypothetical protein AMJ44_06790 [candidate division WOR-1 bacterium DG_54_3]|uniref:Uncharacterized protein n=1 Tax=candidate division WOR-1 bacterium DG_54_3 TaxID=1703775 RepID=A0A0S7Y0P4_UNCSA|nr:MAG: hypothetical protein AMJ44_06790 [candidate division WOR-1 bacterium DG_54_3]
MIYFYQDIAFVSISILFLFFLAGRMLFFRRFPKGSPFLLGLILIFSTAGLSDLAFRWTLSPTILLSADALNVFCFVFALAILSHYSLTHFFKGGLWADFKFFWMLYAPALVISALHIFTPLMIDRVFSCSKDLQLCYNSGYWVIVIYGIGFSLLSLLLNFGILAKSKDLHEKNQSIFLLLVLLLLIYFYTSSLILPFFFNIVNFVSPLPTTFAIAVLVYAHIRYHYFSFENVPKANAAH